MLKILLSNDDGISAPGIQLLAKALRAFAQVQIVTPDRNRSGSSNALTLRTGKILNINVTDLPLAEIKGIRVTRCGSRHPAEQVLCQQDSQGQDLYWIGSPGDKFDAEPDTDFAAIEPGYVSVTPLQVDLTAYAAQDRVKKWLIKTEVDREC